MTATLTDLRAGVPMAAQRTTTFLDQALGLKETS